MLQQEYRPVKRKLESFFTFFLYIVTYFLGVVNRNKKGMAETIPRKELSDREPSGVTQTGSDSSLSMHHSGLLNPVLNISKGCNFQDGGGNN